MKKGSENDDIKIRKTIRKKGYTHILKYAALISGNKPGPIDELGFMASVSKEIFHEYPPIHKTVKSAVSYFKEIEFFSSLGNTTFVTKRAIQYLSKK